MRRPRLLALSIGLGCGCGAQPGTATVESPTPIAPAPAPAAMAPVPTAPPPAKAPAPPAIAASFPTGPEVCRWEHGAWWGDIGLAPGEAPVARIVGAHAVVVAPETTPGMYVVADGDGVQIAAWIHRPSLSLTRSVALAQVVYPHPWTLVTWRGLGRVGALEVSLDASATLASPPQATVEVACDAVATELTEFAESPGVPDEPPVVRSRVEAPLSVTPGGPPVARLRGGVALHRGARRGAATQVFAWTDDYVVAGWVPTRTLTSSPSADSRVPDGSLGPEAPSTRAPDDALARCPGALDLFIEQRGQRAAIGTLAAGTAATERRGPPDDAGFAPVRPFGAQWLQPLDGAQLLARAADLDACDATARRR